MTIEVFEVWQRCRRYMAEDEVILLDVVQVIHETRDFLDDMTFEVSENGVFVSNSHRRTQSCARLRIRGNR